MMNTLKTRRTRPHHGEGPLDRRAKDAFWSVVEDCLIEFHAFGPAEAHRAAGDRRALHESARPATPGEVACPEAPFYVASDLAGLHDPAAPGRLLDTYRIKYNAILALRNS